MNQFKDKESKHYEIYDGLEAIDIIENTLTKEEFIGFCKGNILKYQLRMGKKDGTDDTAKIKKYKMLLESLTDVYHNIKSAFELDNEFYDVLEEIRNITTTHDETPKDEPCAWDLFEDITSGADFGDRTKYVYSVDIGSIEQRNESRFDGLSDGEIEDLLRREILFGTTHEKYLREIIKRGDISEFKIIIKEDSVEKEATHKFDNMDVLIWNEAI